MKQTENYSLNQPEASDYADIDPISENFGVIDTQLKLAENHRNDQGIHVTEEEKKAWDQKAPGTVSETVTDHIEDATIHVTAQDKQKWNEYNTVYTLVHQKSGTVHQLTGLNGQTGILSCLFTAAAAYSSGDTFTVDGTAYTVKMQDGKDPTDGFFTSGAIVPVIVDTTAKTVNFKTGGVDISSATAGPEDVLAGKTFFSGSSDLIQTGTMDSPLVLLQTGQVELESTQVGSLGWRSYATIQAPSGCDFAVILYEDRIGCGAPDLDAPSNSDLSVTFSGSQISISIWGNVSSCTYYLYQNKGGGF